MPCTFAQYVHLYLATMRHQPSAMVKGSGVLNDLLPPLTAHVFDGH
jgi:hypothetical protein